jgi:hypothetical protein
MGNQGPSAAPQVVPIIAESREYSDAAWRSARYGDEEDAI